MLNVVAPVLSPHTEYTYGYDQEVVSRHTEGEVGGPEAGSPQSNEDSERRSHAQLDIALDFEEEHGVQEAGSGNEEGEHRYEEGYHRCEETGHRYEEGEYRYEEAAHGEKESRSCAQEERIRAEEHRYARAEAQSLASHPCETCSHRGDVSGYGCRPGRSRRGQIVG